jgi:SAM-dependent methyltransferase
VGCGAGVHTLTLAEQNPDSELTAVDVSPLAVEQTRARLGHHRLTQVTVEIADAASLPFSSRSFDYIVVLFVLEHLSDPWGALVEIRRVLRAGGRLLVLEGDHGTTCFFPWSQAGAYVIDCAVRVQRAMGGDACMGRRLQPLLAEAGFSGVRVTPCPIYSDATCPERAQLFGRQTFLSMLVSLREQVAGLGLLDPRAWQRGIEDLGRATEPGGSLTYTFFRARAVA